MRKRWLVAAPVAVAVMTGAAVWWHGRARDVQYVTQPASRGDVNLSVVATGTVNPVVTVQVGSYVSGVIEKLYCDFNTQVKAGQLCAKIDPRPFQVVVDQAKANLESARAQLAKDRASLGYARITYHRDQGLLARGAVSHDTVDSEKSAYDQGLAQLKLDEATILQRKAALEAAQVNLAYTDIVSPVDGTVVSRNVDVGQTVAASFQTPTLFLIAQDLKKMQVDTYVSESDVGGVKVGEDATFTVEAYPDDPFHGKVTQVRQAPITTQNVVTYDVVIGVSNPKLELLPGMTANARIVTAQHKDVLRVPAAALRFVPERLGGPSSARESAGSGIWILRNGEPVRVPVTIGLDDGTWAEVKSGGLRAGQKVVVNEIGPSSGTRRSRRPMRSPIHP